MKVKARLRGPYGAAFTFGVGLAVVNGVIYGWAGAFWPLLLVLPGGYVLDRIERRQRARESSEADAP